MRTLTAAGPTEYSIPFAPHQVHRSLVVSCGLATLLFAMAVAFFMDVRDPDSLQVFGSYWASGVAASHGLDPYAAQPQTWIYHLRGVTVVDLNLNPPVLLPLFQGLAHFDIVTMAKVWLFASWLLFFGTTLVLLGWLGPSVQKRQIVWMFVAPAFIDTLMLGQIYVGLFALSTLAWIGLTQRRFILAGVAIGVLVAIKPTFVIWPALLLLAGHWRLAATAALVCITLSALPAVLYGPEIYVQWLAALAADQHSMIPTDASLQGYFARVGLKPLGSALAATLLFGTAGWVWKRRFSPTGVTRIAIALTILVSPLSWMHYTLMLIPALIDRPWTKTLQVAAALLAVPVLFCLQAIGSPVWIVALLSGIYLSAVLLIFGVFVARLHEQEPGLTRRAPARPARPLPDERAMAAPR